MSGWRVRVHILNSRGSAALTYFTVVSQFSYPHHPRSACGLDFSLAASHDDPSWNRDEDTRRLLNKYGCCWENTVATLHQQKPDINLYVVFCAQGILLAVQWLLLYSVSRWPGHMATHVARQPQIDGWWEENSMENPSSPSGQDVTSNHGNQRKRLLQEFPASKFPRNCCWHLIIYFFKSLKIIVCMIKYISLYYIRWGCNVNFYCCLIFFSKSSENVEKCPLVCPKITSSN